MIELRAVVRYRNEGHTNVDIIVKVGESEKLVTHRLGVDIKPNHGKIITFLGDIYGVPAGQIVWPAHIEL